MRFALASFFLFGLGVASRGETPPHLAAKPPPAETPPSDATPRRHRLSPELTAKLSSLLPKYAPSKGGTGAPPAPAGDLPANDILWLPHYEVREQKVPDFREREMLTPQGRLDVVVKRHPGLNFGPLKSWNLRRGLEMLAEEQALERSRELAELSGFARDADRLRRAEKRQPPSK